MLSKPGVDQADRPSLWQLFVISLITSQRTSRPALDILNSFCL